MNIIRTAIIAIAISATFLSATDSQAKYCDDETDLVYYGYRYYNPSAGRWLSRDPLGDEAFFNQLISLHPDWDNDHIDMLSRESLKPCYVFVGNSPLNYFDLDGCELGYDYCCDGRMTPPIQGQGAVDAGEVIFACAGAGTAIAVADCVAANMPRILSTCKNVRCKVSIHPPHHGKQLHLDITCWMKGVKGSDIRWDMELPPW